MIWAQALALGVIIGAIGGILMGGYKARSKLSRFAIQASPIIFMVAIMIGAALRSPIWMDEYIFYRLSSGLPDYSTSADWIFEDRPELLIPSVDWEDLDRKEAFTIAYETPVFPHTPLPAILAWPVVRTLDLLADKGVIDHIEGSYNESSAETITFVLRLIPIALFAVSMWMIHKMLKARVGLSAYCLSMPIAASLLILFGTYMFYWDAFLSFFFILTLYLMETKPNSKWQYLAACCLVNTKMFIGIFFLIPLIVKGLKQGSWKGGLKMALPALSILPFYITTVVVTHDPLYVFTHFLDQGYLWTYSYDITYLSSPMTAFATLWNLGMPFYLAMTVPILWYFKKYPVEATYWIVTMAYAWCAGAAYTHLPCLHYSGALVWPLIADKWHLVDRIRRTKITGKTE